MVEPDRRGGVDRRDFLRAGAAFGLGLGDLLRLEAGPRALARAPRATAVIQIFLPGGIAHQEFVDPKPAAPREYRGEFDAIPTRLTGERFSEHLRHTATIADRLTVIRSFSHTEVDHDRGTHNMLTGYRPSPALVHPSIGSIVAHELGPRNELPPYVVVPNPFSTYNGSGFLSSAYGPFRVGADPGRPGYEVRDLQLPDGVDAARFARRRTMLEAVDAHFRAVEAGEAVAAVDAFQQRAYAMLSSSRAREAFDIAAEPDAVRDRYGAGGERLLLARRLVEAGVRFVSTSIGDWDTHSFHFLTMQRQLPRLDQAFAALIQDLDERGLLDTTIVTLTTEFGRTPKINGMAGRDHWPRVFSGIVAGGGFARGLVFGASDALADTPARDPLSPEDFAATVYHLLGVRHARQLMSPGDRPVSIVQDGRVEERLLA